MKIQKHKKIRFFSGVKRKYIKATSALIVALTGLMTSISSVLPAYANGIPNNGGNPASPSQNVDQTWNDIVGMIFIWAGRAALVLAAWGAFQFFLAFKSDDGEKKQSSLFMLIAGIGAFAVTLSLDLFGIL